MPDFKYKTPNGKIVPEQKLRDRYGSKFDSLVDNNTFSKVDETVYETPNGKFEIESVLKEKYGNRFSDLVENNTFKQDKASKKKEVSGSSSQNQELDSEQKTKTAQQPGGLSDTSEQKPKDEPATISLSKEDIEREQNRPQKKPEIEIPNQEAKSTEQNSAQEIEDISDLRSTINLNDEDVQEVEKQIESGLNPKQDDSFLGNLKQKAVSFQKNLPEQLQVIEEDSKENFLKDVMEDAKTIATQKYNTDDPDFNQKVEQEAINLKKEKLLFEKRDEKITNFLEDTPNSKRKEFADMISKDLQSKEEKVNKQKAKLGVVKNSLEENLEDLTKKEQQIEELTKDYQKIVSELANIDDDNQQEFQEKEKYLSNLEKQINDLSQSYNNDRQKSQELYKSYSNYAERYENNVDDLGSVEQEMDLFDRMYGIVPELSYKLASATSTLAADLGSALEGGTRVLNDLPVSVSKEIVSFMNPSIKKESLDKAEELLLKENKNEASTSNFISQQAKRQSEYARGLAETIDSKVRKDKEFEDIDGFFSGARYTATAITRTAPTLAASMTPAGVTAFMASGAGSKYNEMMKEVEESREDYSPLNVFASMTGSAAIERLNVIKIKALNKGKRVATAAKKEGGLNTALDVAKSSAVSGVENFAAEGLISMSYNLQGNLFEGQENHILDNFNDRAGSGFLVGLGLTSGSSVASYAMNSFLTSSQQKKKKDLQKSMSSLKNRMSDPNLSDDTKQILKSEFLKLTDQAVSLQKETSESIDKMTDDEFKKVKDGDKRLFKIKRNIVRIKNNNELSENEKVEALEGLKEESKQILKERETIISNTKQRNDNAKSETQDNETQPKPDETETETGIDTETKPLTDDLGQENTLEESTGDPDAIYTKDDKRGKLVRNGDIISFETGDEIIDIANVNEDGGKPLKDFGISLEKEVDVAISDNNDVTVDGKTYKNRYSKPSSAVTENSKGEYSVTLETDNGQKRTFKGRNADQIAYQIKLKEYNENATKEQQERAEQLADEAIAKREADEASTQAANQDTRTDDQKRLDEVREERKRQLENAQSTEQKPASSVQPSVQNFADEVGENQQDLSDVSQGALQVAVGDSNIVLNEKNGNIVIDSVNTPEDSRGKGSARKAIQKAVDVANNQGKTLQLDVKPLDDTTTTEGLTRLYESFGFKADPEVEGRMIKEPDSQNNQQSNNNSKTKNDDVQEQENQQEQAENNQENVQEENQEEVKIKLGKSKNALEFTVKKNKNGDVEVFRPDGTVEKNQKNKVLLEYAKRQNLTQGKKSTEEGNEIQEQTDALNDVAENSENPAEVAQQISSINLNQIIENSISYIDQVIANGISTVSRQSFLRFGDGANIGQSLGKSYLRNKGSVGIDGLAQELSETAGVEITPNDIVEFMMAYPNGPLEVRSQAKKEFVTPLENKFQELTGLPANPNIIQEAVNQAKQKELREQNMSALDVLTDEQLQTLYNEREQAEAESIRERDNDAENSSDSRQEQGVQEESGESDQSSKNLSEDRVIKFLDATDQQLKDFGNDNLGIGLPVVVARGVVNIVKAAYSAGKTTAQAVQEAMDYIKSTDWYQSLSRKQQNEVDSDTVLRAVAEDVKANQETPTQAQGIDSNQQQRDSSLGEGGPVKNTNEFKERAKRFWNQTFRTNAGTTKEIGNLVRSLTRETSAITNALEHELSELSTIIKSSSLKEKREFNKNAKAVNDYLLGVDGVDVSFLSKKQLAKVDALRGRVDKLSENLNQKLEDKKTELSKRLDETKEGTSAYESIQEAIKRVSNLQQTIKDNKGSYLHRSYDAFKNDKYLDQLTSKNVNKEGQRRINNASQYLVDESADLFGGKITQAEARKKVLAYLESLKDKSDLVASVNVGSANAPFFKKRKEIPKPFRELLGESNDPLLNYASTVYKISNYIASVDYQKNMQKYLLESGLGTYEEGILGYTKLVEDSQSFEDLKGMYVSQETYDAIQDLQPLAKVEDGFYQSWIAFSAATKLSKTVLSPTTTFRNFESGIFLGLNAGFFFASNPKKMANAFRLAWGTKKSRNQLKSESQKLFKYGVLGDGAVSQEVMETINDFSTDLEKLARKGALKATLDVFKKVYALGDDFYKVIGYYTYVDRYKKAGLSQAEAESKAAQRIVDTFPTYSMLPKNIQRLRRIPLVGTFVSFPYEAVRTTSNGFKYMREDVNAGRKTMVAKQAVGMAFANATLLSLGELSKSMMGFDDDDDDKIRDMLPEWQENSKLIYTGKDDYGNPNFIDGTAFFPAETYLKPLRTLLDDREGRGLDDNLREFAKESLDPYLDFDVSFKIMSELFFNNDQYNRKIYEGDNLLQGIFNDPDKIAQHYMKGAGPGVYSNFTEFMRANNIKPDFFGDKFTSYGKEYKNRDAIMGLLGFRFTNLNYKAGMTSLGYDNKNLLRERKYDITRELKSTRELDNDEIKPLIQEYREDNIEFAKSLLLAIKGARKLGLKESDIIRSLIDSNISQEDVKKMMQGINPYLKKISDDASKNFIEDIDLRYSDPKKKSKLKLNYLKNARRFNKQIEKMNREYAKDKAAEIIKGK